MSQCDYLFSLYNSQLTCSNVNRLVLLNQWRQCEWQGTGFGTKVRSSSFSEDCVASAAGSPVGRQSMGAIIFRDGFSCREPHVPSSQLFPGGPYPVWRVHVGSPWRELCLKKPNLLSYWMLETSQPKHQTWVKPQRWPQPQPSPDCHCLRDPKYHPSGEQRNECYYFKPLF